MTIPVLGSGVKVISITTGVSFLHLYYGTDAGVFIGAFSGAVVYVLSDIKLRRVAQVGAFTASFLIGIISSEMAAKILTLVVSKFFSHNIEISKDVGATVAAATGVYVLLKLKSFNIFSFTHHFFKGKPHGNNDK